MMAMKNGPISKMRVLVLVVSIVVLGRVQDVADGQEVEDESEFDYIRGSERGPERWGRIHPEWAACNKGELQSPIDLLSPRVQLVAPSHNLHFFYSPSPATIKNRGHDIEVKWAEETNKMEMNGTKYVLRQCHWHSPSEHTIRGRRYDMELHLVHENLDTKAKSQIAVIGLLYKLGEPNKFLSKMSAHIRAISNSTEELKAGVINPAELVRGRGRRYLRYTGSITTPPCTEGVIWTVDTKIGTVSQEQLKILREGVHDHAEKNARPLQPQNGRKIRFFREPKSPSFSHHY